MKRKDWTFEYTAAKLADAAQVKVEHHNDRRIWWSAKLEEVMQEVRDTGIEVSESVAASYSNTSAFRGPQVMVRNDLQEKLSECHMKLHEHTDKAKEYAGWSQFFNASPEARLQLDNDDWLFFFGQ